MPRRVADHRQLRREVRRQPEDLDGGRRGLFLASVKGPGTVWLQSLPLQRIRAAITGMSQSRALAPRLLYLGVVIIIVIATLIGKRP